MIGSKVNDILVFLAVVEMRSFVAAGKIFGLSRSTAGKAVARLENSYGARLLNRTTRALDMTEEGRKLYDRGLAIREAIEIADDTINSDCSIPRGVLRITAPDALGRKLLLPTVDRYLETWPETQIELSLSDRIDNIIEEGFDLAIRVGKMQRDQSFISRTLMKDETVLCAAPSYFEKHGKPSNIEQLIRHNLLQFASRNERQSWYLQDDNSAWVRAQGYVRLRLDSAEALREAAIKGLGITMLPRLLVDLDIAAGRLEKILPQTTSTISIVALYPHKRLLEARVRQFIDMLSEDLKGMHVD